MVHILSVTMEVELKEKGRVVIPARIRKSLGLQPGDKLKVEVLKGEIKFKPSATVRAKDLRGVARIKNVDLEEVEEAAGANL